MTAAILAGGKSERMGRDKAEILLPEGVTLLHRTAAVALEVCDAIIIIGRVRPLAWFLPRTTFLPDETPGLGPAGGLITALHQAPGPVLALACDMPRLTPDALRWLRGMSSVYPHTPGVAAVHGENIEPLFALYRPICLPILETRVAAGRRSLQGLLAALPFAFAEVPLAHRPALANVNTPDDLRQAGVEN